MSTPFSQIFNFPSKFNLQAQYYHSMENSISVCPILARKHGVKFKYEAALKITQAWIFVGNFFPGICAVIFAETDEMIGGVYVLKCL